MSFPATTKINPRLGAALSHHVHLIPFIRVVLNLLETHDLNIYLFIYIYFFMGLGSELRALCSQSRHSTTLATPPMWLWLFCSGYFEDGVS
jgi:hypothetical protein